MSEYRQSYIKGGGVFTCDEAFLILVGQVLETLAHGLRKYDGRENTSQHEKRKDLETGTKSEHRMSSHNGIHSHMLHKFVRAVNILQAGETYLGDNRTELATGGGNTVSGRTVTS